MQMVNTTVSSMWTSDSPTYSRPGNSTSRYFYDTFDLKVPRAGYYAITSRSFIDAYGYLYNDTFLPYDPEWALIAWDDDSGGNLHFRIEVYLQRYVTYTLVATTNDEEATGRYSVTVSGPVRVSFIRTTVGSISTTITPPSK